MVILILTQPWPCMNSGTILLKGGYEEDEGSFEFFNMTKEIETNGLIVESSYNIPEGILKHASKEVCKKVETFFEERNKQMHIR